MTHQVVITQEGRGGSIRYNEGDRTVVFSWEFALPPTLALIFGPPSARWDVHYPWAAGRQQEIFDRVGTAVLKREAPSCYYSVNLVTGMIDIIRASDREDEPAARIRRVPREAPRSEWTPPPRDIEADLRHHLSFDVRLRAAEDKHALDPSFDVEGFVAGQIRDMYEVRNGLALALRLAAAHPGERMQQALLYASWNQTHCSQDFARLLLQLKGITPAPEDEAGAAMLEGLGFHTSYFTRKAAFDELCRRTGMTL